MSTSYLENTSGMVLTTKGLKLSSTNTNSIAVTNCSWWNEMLPLWKPAPHKWELFKKNGYPDWWYELQAKKKNDLAGADANKGKVVIMLVEPHLSLIS